MLAVLALVAFIVAIVVYGSAHGWVFWMLLGLALFAASYLFDAVGWGERFRVRR